MLKIEELIHGQKDGHINLLTCPSRKCPTCLKRVKSEKAKVEEKEKDGGKGEKERKEMKDERTL